MLNAVITVNPDALREAAALDSRCAAGRRLGAAHCVPVLVKDNIQTRQVRTTFGSSLFARWRPAADAHVVAELREHGAIVLAKGNLDDFAAAVYGVSEIDGPMRNPYDPTRTVGGSSGGPAAGVTADYAPLGIGTRPASRRSRSRWATDGRRTTRVSGRCRPASSSSAARSASRS